MTGAPTGAENPQPLRPVPELLEEIASLVEELQRLLEPGRQGDTPPYPH